MCFCCASCSSGMSFWRLLSSITLMSGNLRSTREKVWGATPSVVVIAPQPTRTRVRAAPDPRAHLTNGIRYGRLVRVLRVPHGRARVDPDRPLGALPESQLDDAVFRDLWSVVRAKGQADSPGGTRAKARRSPRSV